MNDNDFDRHLEKVITWLLRTVITLMAITVGAQIAHVQGWL